MTDDETIARAFRALSHPRRAYIFRLLSAQPELGRSFDTLRHATGLRETPLRHHLREMERCGLIARKRKGLNMSHALTPGSLRQALAKTQLRAATPCRAA